MQTNGGGEIWESTAGPLGLRRSHESIGENDVLVSVELTNDADEPVGVRVIEDVPAPVESTTLVTAVGGDPSAWRQVGDWILHEAEIPPGETRTNVYVLESSGNRIGHLPAPRIRSVERHGDYADEKASPQVEKAAAIDDEGAVTVHPVGTGGLTDESPSAAETEQPRDGAILDTLLEALEANAEDDRRRELQAELGLSPSERARFDHVQSRLDDLSAYVGALEVLVDEHGIDVVESMQASISDNEERTESLRTDLDRLEAVSETHRSKTADELDDVRDELAGLAERFEARLQSLEATLEDTQAELATLHRKRRADRQASARDRRKLHDELVTLRRKRESDRQARARDSRDVRDELASVQSTVDSLEGDVSRFEAFRERFTQAFSSDSATQGETTASSTSTQENVHPAE